MIAIKAVDLSKKYDIYAKPGHRIKELLSLGRRTYHRELWALRNVDFELEVGNTLGVVGSNGAGKSTLLRLLARISLPTGGGLFLNGRVSTILELGVGFNPDFSGRDNIYMNGAILGLSEEEINSKFDEIVDFAELEEFINLPVKSYSSGMCLRLGFSIATCIDFDILLIDEVLSVGDQYFQWKCVERIKDFKSQGKTIVFVSHDLFRVRQVCDRVIWIKDGTIELDGSTSEVIEEYANYEREKQGDRAKKAVERRASEMIPEVQAGVGSVLNQQQPASWESEKLNESKLYKPAIYIKKVKLLDDRGIEKHSYKTGDTMIVSILVESPTLVRKPVVGVGITRNDDVLCYATSTAIDGLNVRKIEGEALFEVIFDSLALLSGEYELSVGLLDESSIYFYDVHERLYRFKVVGKVSNPKELPLGMVTLEHRWKLG